MSVSLGPFDCSSLVQAVRARAHVLLSVQNTLLAFVWFLGVWLGLAVLVVFLPTLGESVGEESECMKSINSKSDYNILHSVSTITLSTCLPSS